MRGISDGISYTCLGKTLQSQPAGLAGTAGEPIRRRIVAARGQPEVHPQIEASADDLRLGERDQRCVDLEMLLALHSGPGCQRGPPPERLDVFLPAIGVA